MAKYVLTANQSEAISQVGRYFRVLTSADNVHVRILARGIEYYSGEMPAGLGVSFDDRNEFPEPFDQVIVTSATSQTVDLWVELAKADDDRLSGNFDINAALTVANTAPRNHSVSKQSITGATEVLPFLASRKTALIQVSDPVNVQSADGVELSGVFTWENQSALTLVPKSGTVEVRINEDYD